MSQRGTQIKRVDSKKVQGKGSYVEFRKFTYEERKTLRAQYLEMKNSFEDISDDEAYDNLVENLETVVLNRLEGWNWVDAEGAALPLPKSSEDLGKLLDEEVQFLFDSVQALIKGTLGQDEASKN